MNQTDNSQITSDIEKQRGIKILFISIVAVGMGQTLFSALLPPIARNLGLNEMEVGLMFTLSAICWTIFSPVWGRISDNIGRKPVIMIGMMAFSFSTGSFGYLLQYGIENAISVVTLYILLVLSRAIYGVFGSGTPVAAQAYIADRTSRSERSKGVAAIGAAFGFGAILGPGFAAVLAVYSLFLPFYLLALIGFFGLMSTLIFLTERRRPEVFENIPETRLRLNDKRISGLMLIGAGTSFVQAILLQISAFFVLDVLHLNAQETTSLVGVGMMGMAIMTLFSQLVVIPKLDPSVRTMLISGAILLVIPFCMFLLPMSKTLLVVSMVISGFGFGLIRTGTAAGASLVVEPEEQGAVAGLIGATAAIGIIFVPITAMALYSYVDPVAPYILGLVVSAIMLFMVSGAGFRHMNRVLSQDTPII